MIIPFENSKYIINHLNGATTYYLLGHYSFQKDWFWVRWKKWDIPNEEYFEEPDTSDRRRDRYFRPEVSDKYRGRRQSGEFWYITNIKYNGTLLKRYGQEYDYAPELNKEQLSTPEERRKVYKSIVHKSPRLYSIRGVDALHRKFLESMMAEYMLKSTTLDWKHVDTIQREIFYKNEKLEALYKNLFNTKYSFTRAERYPKLILGLIHLGLLDYETNEGSSGISAKHVWIKPKKTLNELVNSPNENEVGVVATIITDLI
jgi:hypothetical protein